MAPLEESPDAEPLTKPFTRNTSGLFSIFIRKLPPQPPDQLTYEITWPMVRERTSGRIVVTALVMLMAVILGISIMFKVPFLHLTLIGTFFGIIDFVSGDHSWKAFASSSSSHLFVGLGMSWPFKLLVGLPVSFGAYFLARFLLRALPAAALHEEQLFREGAENWSWGERAKASFLFGFAHVSNLIYSVATMLALSVGGFIFTWYYLAALKRTGNRGAATLEVATLHCVYNFFAVGATCFWLMYLVWA